MGTRRFNSFREQKRSKAYAVQTETQQQELILNAVERTGNKNIVLRVDMDLIVLLTTIT